MTRSKHSIISLAAVAGAFLCAMTAGVAAQDLTHPPTTRDTGPASHVIEQTQVNNAEVIHVSGHQVVVELEDGRFELLDLPEDFRFQVDGKDLTIQELTPGTKLSQEIHTVTTPQEITTLRTMQGRVWSVNGPHLILSFPGGKNKEYTVPKGTVFKIDGQEKTVFELREGMQVSATELKIQPQNLISRHTVITGRTPPRPDVAFEGPLLIESPKERNVPTVIAAADRPILEELPQTASLIPLAGLLGFSSLAFYAGLRIFVRNGRNVS